MTTNDSDERKQARIDRHGTPDRSDPESMAYWRVANALRDVRPALSEGFAARVAARAGVSVLRPSSLSALIPALTGSLALIVSVGIVALLKELGYLESSPLALLTFVTDLPLAMVAGAAAFAALTAVDAMINERSRSYE